MCRERTIRFACARKRDAPAGMAFICFRMITCPCIYSTFVCAGAHATSLAPMRICTGIMYIFTSLSLTTLLLVLSGEHADEAQDSRHAECYKFPPRGMLRNTPSGVQTAGGGFQVGTDTISRATKMFKIYIPSKRFTRSGTITYENNSNQVKFFDFH